MISFTNYQLPITNYQLPITNYQLPITNYQKLMDDKQILMIPGPTPVPQQALLALAKHPILPDR